jgi:hypothetical protein
MEGSFGVDLAEVGSGQVMQSSIGLKLVEGQANAEAG